MLAKGGGGGWGGGTTKSHNCFWKLCYKTCVPFIYLLQQLFTSPDVDIICWQESKFVWLTERGKLRLMEKTKKRKFKATFTRLLRALISAQIWAWLHSKLWTKICADFLCRTCPTRRSGSKVLHLKQQLEYFWDSSLKFIWIFLYLCSSFVQILGKV